jgi:hypothetical protein
MTNNKETKYNVRQELLFCSVRISLKNKEVRNFSFPKLSDKKTELKKKKVYRVSTK